MNWQMVVAIGSVLGIVGQFGIAAYFYGKLTQSVVDVKEDVREHTVILKELGATSGDHGEAIASLQARPRYVNGSSH